MNMQCEICDKNLVTEYITDRGVILCKRHYDSWAEAKNKHNQERIKEEDRILKSNQYIKAKLDKLKGEVLKGKKYFMTEYEIMRWFNLNPRWKNYYNNLKERTIETLRQDGYLI